MFSITSFCGFIFVLFCLWIIFLLLKFSFCAKYIRKNFKYFENIAHKNGFDLTSFTYYDDAPCDKKYALSCDDFYMEEYSPKIIKILLSLDRGKITKDALINRWNKEKEEQTYRTERYKKFIRNVIFR